MGMIRRSSATSLAGWFVLLAVLLSAITVTAYAVTRSGAPKPPQRSLASAVHIASAPAPGHRRLGAVHDRPAPARGHLLDDLGQPALGRDGTRLGRRRPRPARHPVAARHDRARLRRPPGDAVRQASTTSPTSCRSPTTRRRAPTARRPTPCRPSPRSDRGIARLGKVAVVSGAIPSNVAGQKAYTVRASPRHNGGLFGNFELAWDAARGVPLHFADLPARVEHGRDLDHRHPHPLRPGAGRSRWR